MKASRDRVSLLPWTGLLVLLLACGAHAQNDLAPLNPDFLVVMDRLMAGTWPMTTPEGYGLGYIPPPVRPDANLPPGLPERPRDGAPPAAYDLRDTADKVPPIRNQSNCGSCWGFGTYGSLETCARPGDDLDCSENHLKNNHGFDWTCCDGGNPSMSTAYLARWDGPLSEASDPYTTACTSLTGAVQRHVQEAWWLPTNDPTAIKNAIMDYGGVSTAYYSDSGLYYNNGTNTSYYYDGSNSADHVVTIIGWDDTYPTSNFDPGRTQPTSPGAWLVRNSWGTWNGSGPGYGGYFWCSYEDTWFAKTENTLFPNSEPTTNFAACHDYDPLGATSYYGPTGAYQMCANIFPSSQQQQLESVGFYTAKAGTSYDLYVYVGCDADDPTTGTLAHSSSGAFTYSGYHTVDLGTPPVNIPSSAARFSVVLGLDSGTWHLAIEYPFGGYSSGATASAGESFYGGTDGSSWADLTSIYANTNFCIKAFTYPGPLPVRLLGLRAVGEHGQVRVLWETASEFDVVGFNVLRSERPDGPFVRINEHPITATGQPGEITTYEFVDDGAEPGQLYSYRIAEVSASGTVNQYEDTGKGAVATPGLYDLLPPQLRDLVRP